MLRLKIEHNFKIISFKVLWLNMVEIKLQTSLSLRIISIQSL